MQEVIQEKLCLVMPFYNEQECLERVVIQWISEISKYIHEFTILLVNDGSNDKSPDIASVLQSSYQSQIECLSKPNSGHGQSCIAGYKWAVQNNYDWVMQVDSDGQCSPDYFINFWKNRKEHPVIYACRNKREDGFARLLFSRIFSFFCYLTTGVYVRDLNVPYRLFHKKKLQPYLEMIPGNFYLANVCLAFLHAKYEKIYWIDIMFKKRIGGNPSANYRNLLLRFIKCLISLRALSLKTEKA